MIFLIALMEDKAFGRATRYLTVTHMFCGVFGKKGRKK
jgi:hypothetical protein